MCKRDSTVENDYDFSTIVHVHKKCTTYMMLPTFCLENFELKHG